MMPPMPLMRAAQTEGGPPSPPGGGAQAPPGAADLLGPQAGGAESPEAKAQARMGILKQITDLVDALAADSPESAKELQDLKNAVKRATLSLVKNSAMPGPAQP